VRRSDHPGERDREAHPGREPHRPGRNEPGGEGAEATQAGEEDPQTSRSEGDPGDKGQDSEALFRLRGGAQGCRRWRRGGARSVDTHAGTGGNFVLGAGHFIIAGHVHVIPRPGLPLIGT